MTMTQIHVETSLNEWFSENYSGEADWGGLDQFDPESDDLESWVHFCVDMIKEDPVRKNNKKIYHIRIVVMCWARDTEDVTGKKDLYRARRKASEISELLRHEEIEVKSYASSEDTGTVVGNCRLYEPKTTREEDDDNSGYTLYMVMVDGFAQEA